MATIAMLHPGAMGAAVGASLAAARHEVRWVVDGRSKATHERAGAAGLVARPTIASAVADAGVVVSLCPPNAAVEVARAVARAGFTGTYVDANAVQPTTARTIDAMFDDVVDGSVIGGPPAPGDGDRDVTRLYLSGPGADRVAKLFDDDALEVMVLEGPVGAASAVKMGFAGWTKGTAALIMALRALARAEGVEDELVAEWRRRVPDVAARSERVAAIAAKAWRFEGELREIAAALAAHDLPDGFHLAGADVYASLADLRHARDPTLDDIMDRLTGNVG